MIWHSKKFSKVPLRWHVFISFDDLLNSACKGIIQCYGVSWQENTTEDSLYQLMPQWTNEYRRLILPSCIYDMNECHPTIVGQCWAKTKWSITNCICCIVQHRIYVHVGSTPMEGDINIVYKMVELWYVWCNDMHGI